MAIHVDNVNVLLKQVRQALHSRALRLGGAGNTEFGSQFVLAGTAAGTVPAGKTWIVLEFDNTQLGTFTDKAAGPEFEETPTS